jgi:hypothetical protein
MLRLMYDAGEQAFFDLQEPGSRKLRIATRRSSSRWPDAPHCAPSARGLPRSAHVR